MVKTRYVACGLVILAATVALGADTPQTPVVIVHTGAPPAPTQPEAAGDPFTQGGFVAGGSLYYLRPYHSSNTALITTRGLGTDQDATRAADFDWNWSASPALWLGWTGESGLGVRARY